MRDKCGPDDATIPSVIHFVFGLGDAPEEFIFPWFIAILSAQLVNSPDRIVFHYGHQPFGAWWRETLAVPGLELRHHASVPQAVGRKTLKKRAHRADVLRLQILLEEGGAYMDIDTVSVRPYASHAFGREFVIGLQAPEDPPRGRLCNAVMMAAPRCAFVRAWLDAYEAAFDPDGWGEASVDLPFRLYEEMGDQHCSVAPTAAFLWPPWYRIRQIFYAPTAVPEELLTLHLWAGISGPFLETIRGFEWAEAHPETLYGQLLLRTRARANASSADAKSGSVLPRSAWLTEPVLEHIDFVPVD